MFSPLGTGLGTSRACARRAGHCLLAGPYPGVAARGLVSEGLCSSLLFSRDAGRQALRPRRTVANLYGEIAAAYGRIFPSCGPSQRVFLSRARASSQANPLRCDKLQHIAGHEVHLETALEHVVVRRTAGRPSRARVVTCAFCGRTTTSFLAHALLRCERWEEYRRPMEVWQGASVRDILRFEPGTVGFQFASVAAAIESQVRSYWSAKPGALRRMWP